MRTYIPKAEEITKEWLVVDAAGVPLGRLAAKVATLLRGKHKPVFTPHLDSGDFVVVINSEKVKLTGKKREDKIYYHHSGYIGGLKKIPYGTLLQEKPEFVIREAVRRMLPKGRLGRSMLRKLKVYRKENHPHQAQKPQSISLGRENGGSS